MRALLVCLSILALAGMLAAQPAARFDAVSIHPSTAGDTSNRLGPTPRGGLLGQNVTILLLIAMGYGVRPFQVVYSDGALTDLNSFLPSDSEWPPQLRCSPVSDHGR